MNLLEADLGQAGGPVLHLLGGPVVTIGCRRVQIPEGSKRVVAFAAVRQGRVDRRAVAGMLWPDGEDTRAAGNLRSALWRLKVLGVPLLNCDKSSLAIRDDVVIDTHVLAARAARLIGGCSVPADLNVDGWNIDALDLLPGWYDDWAVVERERIRQLALHAIEALSRELVERGRCAEAVAAALTATAMDPLRESAQRTLIRAHLAEGNLVEARRCFVGYRRLLRQELGAEPDPTLAALVVRPGYPTAGPLARVRTTASSR